MRNLEVMGESVKKLPKEWKQTQPQVEWVKVGDFRNVLAHDYLEVDLDIVWNIIENYLPDLEAAMQALIETEKQGGSFFPQ
ncbi:MAG: HepT-like ribonuclease domain-containing protein [Verrucomicrobiota bacterium]